MLPALSSPNAPTNCDHLHFWPSQQKTAYCKNVFRQPNQREQSVKNNSGENLENASFHLYFALNLSFKPLTWTTLVPLKSNTP